MEPQPLNLYADSVAPVRRGKPDEVFFVRLQGSPQPASEDFGVVGGAFINCYLDADDLRSAEIRAVELIQQHDWQPVRFETWRLICSECVQDSSPEDDGSSARELIQQAREDGEACIFYCWPVDAPDANDAAA